MTERTLTDGTPVPADDSHTKLKSNGQQEGYIILSAAERAKGFVRPLRDSYVHVGPPAPANLRDLTAEEHERYVDEGYAKFEEYPPERHPVMGKFWKQEQLDRISGCGVLTKMSDAIAETYARDPKFYSGTFCVGCHKHFPVGEHGEFVWDGTQERVGT